jgi:hypothetical protein
MRPNLRLFALAAALTAAAPLHADWLVTVDGSEIETEGAWRVDGSQVLFTLQGGGLASLPLADVDLAASEARTNPPAPAAAEEPPAAPPKPTARWVLTDGDVARTVNPEAAAAPGAGDGEGGETAAPSLGGLSVTSWDDVALEEGEPGIALRGTVHNGGSGYATSVTVKALLYDAEGQLLEMRTNAPVESALEPGASSEFRIEFPDVTSFSGVQFTVDGQGIAAGATSAEEGDEDGGG